METIVFYYKILEQDGDYLYTKVKIKRKTPMNNEEFDKAENEFGKGVAEMLAVDEACVTSINKEEYFEE
jgi:hypothetical protein